VAEACLMGGATRSKAKEAARDAMDAKARDDYAAAIVKRDLRTIELRRLRLLRLEDEATRRNVSGA
jgi:hypothetical protein